MTTLCSDCLPKDEDFQPVDRNTMLEKLGYMPAAYEYILCINCMPRTSSSVAKKAKVEHTQTSVKTESALKRQKRKTSAEQRAATKQTQAQAQSQAQVEMQAHATGTSAIEAKGTGSKLNQAARSRSMRAPRQQQQEGQVAQPTAHQNENKKDSAPSALSATDSAQEIAQHDGQSSTQLVGQEKVREDEADGSMLTGNGFHNEHAEGDASIGDIIALTSAESPAPSLNGADRSEIDVPEGSAQQQQ